MSETFTNMVIEHFRRPRNAGRMENADAEGTFGDPGCGDALTIYIKVKDDVITDISFLVYGCVAAIASSSVTTILAKGLTLEKAYQIKDKDIISALGSLPEDKMHCSVLGEGALKKAIDNYRQSTANKK